MFTRTSSILLALVLVACSTGNGSSSGTTPPPVEQGEVTSPTSGLDVKAAIASATLGDENCSGTTTSKTAPSCVASGDAGTDGGGGSSDRSGVNCGGGCRPSNMQIAFTTGPGSTAAKIEIVSVVLVDASTGAQAATLTASTPQLWDATSGTYKAWDESLAPSSDVRASYALTSPPWSTLNSSFSTKYKLDITVRVDGATIVLESAALNREPVVAT